MPTLDVPRQRVKPTVPSGLQLPLGAFGAEGRAMQQLGRSISGVGSALFGIGHKIKLLNETNQINEAILSSEQFLDEAAGERLKDTDYENHRPQFDKDWDQFTAETLPKYKSKRVQEYLTNYFGRQGVVQGVRIEADAYLSAGRDERAKQSLVMQQSIEAELAETDAEEQEKINSNYEADQIRLQKAGHIAEWEVDERLKTRAMMMVQTVAQRWPEAAVEVLKSKEALSAILIQKDIDRLTEGDMIFLRKIARSELKTRNAIIASKNKEAAVQAEDGYTKDILGDRLSEVSITAIANDPRLNGFPEIRTRLVSLLERRIKAENDNAKTIATDTQKGEAEDKFDELVETRKFDEAKKTFAENAWMFTRAEKTKMWDSIGKAKDKPMDNLLVESIGISNDLTKLRVKELTTEREIAEERIRGRNLNARLREIAADPKWTDKQKQEQMDALLAPAKEAAAKSLFERVWGWSETSPFGTMYWYRKFRPKKEGEEDLTKMTDEELEAIIRGE